MAKSRQGSKVGMMAVRGTSRKLGRPASLIVRGMGDTGVMFEMQRPVHRLPGLTVNALGFEPSVAGLVGPAA